MNSGSGQLAGKIVLAAASHFQMWSFLSIPLLSRQRCMLAIKWEVLQVSLSGKTGFKSELFWQEPPSSGRAASSDSANCTAALPASVHGGLMLNPLRLTWAFILAWSQSKVN